MLMCRGKGCNWRKVCSRYVLGRAAQAIDMSIEWMDHCLHASKFIRCGGEDDMPMPNKDEGV